MMDSICKSFVLELVEQSTGLLSAYQETTRYWAPDEPPLTILFADLGRRIAADFENLMPDQTRRIFELIETAMTDGEEPLRTAVATGLIEGLAAKATRQASLWLRVLPMFGELSRRHAEAWVGV